ncbi:MAG: hypothetical protein IJD91_03950 [Clostridia bacterium]|nr:hypothetical protein [Clostridia bacterium]
MKKVILGIVKTPLFLIRWINAAIMRFIPTSLMLIGLYCGIYALIYAKDVSDAYDAYTQPFLSISIIISVIWGFLFALTKPTVYKMAYIFRGKPVFGRSITGRVILALVYATAIQSGHLSVRLLSFYCLAELIINIIILNSSKKMPYNPALEAACFGENKG